MGNICSRCGLPVDLCVCESIAKESQKIEIKTIKKKFGKLNTVVEGIDGKGFDRGAVCAVLFEPVDEVLFNR